VESDEDARRRIEQSQPIIGVYGKKSRDAILKDFAECEARIAESTQWFDDRRKCDGCGKVKDRVIRRNLGSNGQPPRMRCDECLEEEKR
jgi:hypothetical protein